MAETRRLAAIMAVDVVGYSRLMGADEAGTALAVREHRDAARPLVMGRGGRIVKTMGDGFLLEFPSVVDAVECAIAIQGLMIERNSETPEGKKIVYRVGVHLGDVLIEGDDILGEGVNIAQRLEGICEPGGVLISGSAHEHVRGRIESGFVDLGEKQLKNIARPVRAYRVALDGEASTALSSTPAKPAPALVLPEKPSIAALPFHNMSGDPEQDYFADGMVEDIITGLSRIKWLFVIARNSSFVYKGKAVDIRQVGRELGVRYVLEGSVRKAGNRLRITAQLIEAETGVHLWADRFDGGLEDVFDLQDRITTSVVVAVEPSLRLVEIERAQRKPTDNLDAYDLYLPALPAINAYTRDGFEEAETLLRRAIVLDPGYADAIASLAECLVRTTVNGWVADKAASTAEACDLAGQAVAIDPENAAVLAIAAWAYSTLGVRFEKSLELANHALALHPNSVHVRSFCGWVFNYFGDSLRAIEQFEEARRLSPIDPKSYFPMLGLAAAHFFAGHFEQTVQLTGRILTEVPTHNVARRYRAAAPGHLGLIEEASAVIADLLKAQPTSNLRSSRSSTFRDPRMSKLYIEGLEKAGLPE